MKLEQLASLCEARLIRGDPNWEVARISTDTRSLAQGDCFIALQGPRFDGHEFLDDAAQRGASAAVVSHPTRAMNSPSALALLQVQDTLTALHKLATNYRRLMLPATRLITISGASGKTTTKEMIAAVLGERFRVVKTPANNNNQIGAPLTVLAVGTEQPDFGVIELGSNHPGEMRVLAELVRPEIAVVTNIGLAHVEHLGDEMGVAKEEGTPLEYLPYNADDKWCNELRGRTRSTVVTVGIDHFADIRASDIKINGDVKFRLNIAKKREDVIIRLRTLGRHQIYNALQAAAVGYGVGMDLDEIREGLENVVFPAMRMEQIECAGIRFVNDCYNANVPSMRAALEMMRDTPVAGRKVAVLGEMHELGAWTKSAHLEVGTLAAQCGLSLLMSVGPAARWIAEGSLNAGMEMHRVLMVYDTAEAQDAVRALVREGDMVLLKGSRRLQLERVLETFNQSEVLHD